MLEIEVQGARQVREAMPEALQVFIAPPSREALRARLVGRGTDTAEQVDARLQTAEGELEAQSEFSHVVVNDRLEDALEELVDIVRGEVGGRRRRPPSSAAGHGTKVNCGYRGAGRVVAPTREGGWVSGGNSQGRW